MGAEGDGRDAEGHNRFLVAAATGAQGLSCRQAHALITIGAQGAV